MNRPNVLISSAGRRVGLVRAFQAAYTRLGVQGRVYACDSSQLSAACWASDGHDRVPRCDDPGFLASIIEICQRRDIGLVVPTIDPELPVYAAGAQRLLSAGADVLVSTPDVVAIGGDKVRTHEWLSMHGFPTVKQWRLTAGLSGDVEFPTMAKPRFGSASHGVRRVMGIEDAITHAGDGDYILQQIADGFEYTVDALRLEQGQPVVCVPRRRIEVRAGEVSKAVTHRFVELQELVGRIVLALPGVHGALNVQVFVDETTGAMNVIEINPRFGGGFPLSWMAGADFPKWLLERRLGMPSSLRVDEWEDGLTMLRFDEAVFVRGLSA